MGFVTVFFFLLVLLNSPGKIWNLRVKGVRIVRACIHYASAVSVARSITKYAVISFRRAHGSRNDVKTSFVTAIGEVSPFKVEE